LKWRLTFAQQRPSIRVIDLVGMLQQASEMLFRSFGLDRSLSLMNLGGDLNKAFLEKAGANSLFQFTEGYF